MGRFYIVNEVDRPDERHVVEKISSDEATYIHPDLAHWGKQYGNFDTNKRFVPVEDFGFIIDVGNNKATFIKTNPSRALYSDGSNRNWQGRMEFVLPLYGSASDAIVNKKDVWTCEALPDIRIENFGNNVYHIINGNKVDCFTNYEDDKDKVVKDWFTSKIISNIVGEV